MRPIEGTHMTCESLDRTDPPCRRQGCYPAAMAAVIASTALPRRRVVQELTLPRNGVLSPWLGDDLAPPGKPSALPPAPCTGLPQPGQPRDPGRLPDLDLRVPVRRSHLGN